MIKKLLVLLKISLFYMFVLASSVFAHGGEIEEAGEMAEQTSNVLPTLEDAIRGNSLKAVAIGSVAIGIFVILTILFKDQFQRLKKYLFIGIVLSAILTTLFLAGSTIYLNLNSTSGGPVHWHADFEIWDCGRKLELVDPQGFSNRVGSATLHEHNDGRIHVEGVVTHLEEASLGRFFQFIGGEMHNDHYQIPLNEQIISRRNGDLCPDGQPGTVQAYVYKTIGNRYIQTKIDKPQDYVLSPHGNVPPGDCIIIEFKPEIEETTTKMCDSYKLQKLKGKIHGD